MIPYHDENETQRAPVVTLLLIALNAAAWLLVQGAGAPAPLAASVCELGLIPGELTGLAAPGTALPLGRGLVCLTGPGPQAGHLLSSMFLHGSWAHVIGNMWFLWLFGNNVEDAMTRPRFVAFYLLSGLAAAALQVAAGPASPVPMVGASGAISGVMGGYLLLYPGVRVWTLVPLGVFTRSVALPAWAMLLYWAFLQLAGGLARTVAGPQGGVAFWAHVGGFAAGAALVKLFARRDRLAGHRAASWRPRRAAWP